MIDPVYVTIFTESIVMANFLAGMSLGVIILLMILAYSGMVEQLDPYEGEDEEAS
tara:strand:- start:103 stop:267 length:165 start_codon:yes stop_codon:yes gene_type:complete